MRYLNILREIFSHPERYGKEQKELLKTETALFWEEINAKMAAGKREEVKDMIRQVQECLREFAPRFGQQGFPAMQDLMPSEGSLSALQDTLSHERKAKRIKRMRFKG